MAHLLSDVATVRLDNAAGTITDISKSINSVSIEGGNATVVDTGIGATRHHEIPDIDPIQTITLNGFINTTTEAIIGPLVKGTSVLKTVEVKQLTTQYISGEGLVGSVSRSIPIGLQTFSLELRTGDSTGFIRTSVASA